MRVLIAACLSWTCWLWTLEPTLPTGDSGELASAAYHVGVAHPPGYPMHSLLVRSVQWIPLGNIAFRSNLASSLWSFLALILFGLLLRRVGRMVESRESERVEMTGRVTDHLSLVTFFVVLAFGLSDRVWAHAVGVEVYALQTCGVIVVWGSVVRAQKQPWIWYGVGLVLGMAMVHHPLTWFWAPWVMVAWWKSPIRRTTPGWWWWGAVMLGWMWALVLPIRSLTFPLMDWAHPVDLRGVLDHVLRVNYGAIPSGSSGLEIGVSQAVWYAEWLGRQWPLWSWPLAAWGWWKLRRHDRLAGDGSLIVWIATSFVVLWVLRAAPTPTASYLNQEFFVASSFLFGIWIFLGIGAVGSWMMELGFNRVSRVTCYAIAVALAVVQLFHWPAPQKGIAYWYGVNALNLMEANAVLFAAGDKGVIPLAYLSQVERRRPDIRFVDDIGCVFENIYGRDFLSLSAEFQDGRKTAAQQRLVEEAGSRPIYAMEGSHVFRSVTAFTSYGLVQRMGRTEGQGLLRYDAALKRCWWDPAWDRAEDFIARDMAAEFHYLRAEWARALGRTTRMTQELRAAERVAFDVPWVKAKIGRQVAERSGNPEEAVRLAEESVRLDSSTPQGQNLLGMAYMDAQRYDAAVAAFEKALALDPYFVEALNNVGNAYAARGETGRARAAYERALQLDPRHVRAHNNLGILWFKQGQFGRAISAFQEAVRLDPSYINAHSNLGAAFYKTGRTAEAVKEWEEVLRWDPAHAEARQNLQSVKK